MLAAVLYMSCARAILSDFAFSVQKHTPTSYNIIIDSIPQEYIYSCIPTHAFQQLEIILMHQVIIACNAATYKVSRQRNKYMYMYLHVRSV